MCSRERIFRVKRCDSHTSASKLFGGFNLGRGPRPLPFFLEETMKHKIRQDQTQLKVSHKGLKTAKGKKKTSLRKKA